MKKTNNTALILFLFGIILLSACQSGKEVSLISPVSTTRSFLNAMNNNSPNIALNHVCESMAIPSISKNYLRHLKYDELNNDGSNASVQVTGEIRLEDEDLGAFKKNLDFKLVLEKSGNRWCIQRESLLSIFDSLIDLSY